jgi:hypothetical protein
MNIAKYQSICFDCYLQRSLFPLDRRFSTTFDKKLASFGKNPPVLQISYKRMRSFSSGPVWVGGKPGMVVLLALRSSAANSDGINDRIIFSVPIN